MAPLLPPPSTAVLVPKPLPYNHVAVNLANATNFLIKAPQHGALIAQVVVVVLVVNIFLKDRHRVEERIGPVYDVYRPPTIMTVPPMAAPLDLPPMQVARRIAGLSHAHIKRCVLSLLYKWPLGSLTRLGTSLWRSR